MVKYSSYKSSGIEWIGDIPENWNISKLKNLFENRNEKNVKLENNFLSILKDKGVIPYSEKGNVGNKTSDDISKYKKVYFGDIVINPMNIIIGSVGLSKYDGVLSNVYIVLKSKNINSNFGSYVFQSKGFQQHLKKICYGIMELRESLNKIEFFVEKIPLPNFQEQEHIVKYLDDKTSIIDKLISIKERKIGLLKEQRTSLINEVITKGLNLNVKMKESGVEWIGEIPERWSVKKMKYCLKMISEKKEVSKDDIKISPENVENGTGVCFNFYSDYTGEGMKFIKGDILLNKLRIYLKKILITENEGFSMGEMIVLRTTDGINKYYYYTLFNQGLIDLLNNQSTGVKLPRVSPETILNSYIIFPPIEEQIEIVEYIDLHSKDIDDLVSMEKNKIELLKEYRQSLISEVVTGKIKVV